MFIKWFFAVCLIVTVGILVYIICDCCGVIERYENAIANNNKSAVIVTLVLMLLVGLGYVILSLYNFLSHRADEDIRINCLPMMYSLIFLMTENFMLHSFEKTGVNGEYIISESSFYTVTMSGLSSIAVAVITFASLKFAFEIAAHRSRLFESANAKPDITLIKGHNGFYAEIKKHDCYLCGVYVGKIDKILYRDIKKTGTMFSVSDLFYPNKKAIYEAVDDNQAREIDFSMFLPTDIKSFCNEPDVKGKEIYLIFRDMQHYYYFAQLPYDEDKYNVIGTNEYAMTHLLYKYNKWQDKALRKKCKKAENKDCIVKYVSMDWLKIPYNFYPDRH